jgi:hypothetical protein
MLLISISHPTPRPIWKLKPSPSLNNKYLAIFAQFFGPLIIGFDDQGYLVHTREAPINLK